MKNPYAKDKKKNSKKQGGRKGLNRRRSTADPGSPRSPSKSKKRRTASADSNNMP